MPVNEMRLGVLRMRDRTGPPSTLWRCRTRCYRPSWTILPPGV